MCEDETSNVQGEALHHVVQVETPKLLTTEASVDVMEGTTSQSNKTKYEVDHDGTPKSKRRCVDILVTAA